jgi:hypothetical protein
MIWLSSDHTKRIGHLTKPPWIGNQKRKYKRRTNKELEQRILTILGIEEMRNPYTNSRGTITPLQISKLVPDFILQSFDDILNTMFSMREKGLLHVVDIDMGYNGLKYEKEEIQFQITVDGIIQFRKSIRPIARLVINHEEQYQTIVDKTEGDPKVKAELKKVPKKIKDSTEGYSKTKARAKKIPERIIKKIENKVYDTFADSIVRHGVKAGIFITRLIFSAENAGAEP